MTPGLRIAIVALIVLAGSAGYGQEKRAPSAPPARQAAQQTWDADQLIKLLNEKIPTASGGNRLDSGWKRFVRNPNRDTKKMLLPLLTTDSPSPIYIFDVGLVAGRYRIWEMFESWSAYFDVIAASDHYTVVAYLPAEHAISEAIQKAMRLSPPLFTRAHAQFAMRLRRQAEWFTLTINWPDSAGQERHVLRLAVTPNPADQSTAIKIPKAVAEAVADWLFDSGCIDLALRYRDLPSPRLAEPQLIANAKMEFPMVELGHGAGAIERLKDLRKILPGQAGEQLGRFIASLGAERKAGLAWAATQPEAIRSAPLAVQDEIRQLQQGDAGRKALAARRLASWGQRAGPAVGDLVRLLADDSRVVFSDGVTRDLAYVTAMALGSIAPPAIPAIIEATRTGEDHTRRWAATALGQIKDVLSLRRLLAMVEEPSPTVRAAVAAALGAQGSPDATPALITMLKDKKFGVKYAACMSLAELKDPRAYEPLLEAMRQSIISPPGVGSQAIRCMPNRDKRAANMLIEFVKKGKLTERVQAIHCMANLRDPAGVQVLLEALKDPAPLVRKAALFALGRIRQNVPLDPLLNAIGGKDATVRAAAASAASMLQDERAVGFLVKALRDENADVRWWAMQGIRWIWVASVTSPLGSSNRSYAQQVADRLKRMLRQDAVLPVIEMLKEERCRAAAAEALSRLSGQNLEAKYEPWLAWYQSVSRVTPPATKRDRPAAKPGATGKP